MEDDVGRDAALARDPQADGAQAIEQIVIDVLPRLGVGRGRARRRSVSFVTRRWRASARSGTRRGVLQQRDARFGQRQHRILVVGLPQQPFGA